MKRKLLYTAIVATVMATANPVYAQWWWQPIYEYSYYENGQWVGLGYDACTSSGVVTLGDWWWGYQTSDVHVGRVADCVNGQWTPL